VRPVRGGEWVVLAHCIASFSGSRPGLMEQRATFAHRVLRTEHRLVFALVAPHPLAGGTAAW
jgi:hypothetical protein